MANTKINICHGNECVPCDFRKESAETTVCCHPYFDDQLVCQNIETAEVVRSEKCQQ